MKSTNSSKEGSSLALTMVMLSVACILIGSVVSMITQYSGSLRRSVARERALLLADSGLRYCYSQLSQNNSAILTLDQSRSLFMNDDYGGDNWGFYSSMSNVGGKTNRLVVTGKYGSIEQSIEMWCVDVSTNRSYSDIFKKVLYVGDPTSTTTFYRDDFIEGPPHTEGNFVVNRSDLPFSEMDDDENLSIAPGEGWSEAGVLGIFDSPLSQSEYNAYVIRASVYADHFHNNGIYDAGEAFVDSEGNGIYDPGEAFTDTNGNNEYDSGDSYIDRNNNDRYDPGTDTVEDRGNGQYDAGEAWTEGSGERNNGAYDPAGGFYDNSGNWQTSYTETVTERVWVRIWGSWGYYKNVNTKTTISCADWPAEEYEDVGDGNYQPGEIFVDAGNGYWDEGEVFFDDRNGAYDIGTTAAGSITGMGEPAPGEMAAYGGNASLNAPDLSSMYYHIDNAEPAPGGALEGWGHDVAVTASDFEGHLLKDRSKPEHIFIFNPPVTGQGDVREDNETVYDRTYTPIYYTDENGDILEDYNGHEIRINDYFLEDPTDSTYNSSDSSASIDGTKYTRPMYLDVQTNGNNKVYYVDGNLYLHSPTAYSMRFRTPGTKITIVAKGNITISDEFYYNADYNDNQTRDGMNSSVVHDAKDGLCLIALKNPDLPVGKSGNIYIGDAQYGTGGSIHSMLYAEHNFIDNNTYDDNQPFISIYGNMAAGNRVAMNRTENTRLDITLDKRIADGELDLPGLPPPHESDQVVIEPKEQDWQKVGGTWKIVQQ